MPPRDPLNRRSFHPWVSWLLSLAILALLFWWMPVNDVMAAMRVLDWRFLAVAASMTFVNVLLRGFRWAQILDCRTPRQITVSTCVCAIGLALNAVMPGKAGEFARIGLARKHLNGPPLGSIVAGALAERIFDATMLLCLLALSLAVSDALSNSSGLEGRIHGAAGRLAAGCALLAAVLAALCIPRVNRFLRLTLVKLRRRRYGAIARRASLFIRDFATPVNRLLSPARLASTSGLTILMWLAIGAGVYLTALGTPVVDLSPQVALTFAAVTVIATALPSAPGGWGIFEAVGVAVVLSLGRVSDEAGAFAFVIAAHLVQYLPVVLCGVLGWLVLHRTRRAMEIHDG